VSECGEARLMEGHLKENVEHPVPVVVVVPANERR
jgi:hypothetical protein